MEARRTRKIMFYLKFARHGGLLHEHELYEMLRSRKLYNVQCDLRRHLHRTLRSLECSERVSMAGHEARRTHFLQSTARRERAKTTLVKVKDFFPEGVNRDGSLGSANLAQEAPLLESKVAERNGQFESVDVSVGSETSADMSGKEAEKVEELEDDSVVFKTRLPDSHRKDRPATEDPPSPSTPARRAPSTASAETGQVKCDQTASVKPENNSDKISLAAFPRSPFKPSANGHSSRPFPWSRHQHDTNHAIVVKTVPLRKVPTSQLSHDEVLDFVRRSQCSCDECDGAVDRGRKHYNFWWGKPSRRTTTLPPLLEKPLTCDSPSLAGTGSEHRRRSARGNTSESDLVESTERFRALRLSRLEDVRRRSRDLGQLVSQFRLR